MISVKYSVKKGKIIYHAVEIYNSGKSKKIATGDLVKDFDTAMNLCEGQMVTFSSSIDHLIMDDTVEEYYFDEFDSRIKRTSEKEKNEIKNKKESLVIIEKEIRRLKNKMKEIRLELKKAGDK